MNLPDVQKIGTILVVDDCLINRTLLKSLLSRQVCQFVFAENGYEAIEAFERHRPDMILMDINMPKLDGIEATRAIRKLSDRFCPIVFITSSNDESTIVECVDAGGDDFIAKPFSQGMIQAKVKSMHRLMCLYNQSEALSRHIQRETELAESIFNVALMSSNVGLSYIDLVQMPASHFSGDVLLTAYRPDGDINILLGDFTGHGLSAAIGALPVAGVFRTMTDKGFNSQDILAEMNHKLFSLLPTGMFLALGFVTLSVRLGVVDIHNCGLPDIWVFDGTTKKLKYKVASCHPALGILQSIESINTVQSLSFDSLDTIVMLSDGVTDAKNSHGEMFGDDRLFRVCQQSLVNNRMAPAISDALHAFCGDAIQNDDISFFVIPCGHRPKMPERVDSVSDLELTDTENHQSWQWQMTLTGKELLKINPIPLAINYLQEIEGENEYWHNVFSVLSELHSNALDHGILGLSSSMKQSAQGFSDYFQQRQERLESLASGEISITLHYQRHQKGDVVTMMVKDSGPGFDVSCVHSD
ncbi:SpoIIE family protein phosphatase [bacterium]|nr:SpoIIE family protein phosphatase [bacterium]